MTDTMITAFKGFDKNLACRGYQFKLGETYTHDGKVKACKSGFHSCENPMDVLNYYPIISDDGSLNRFAIVKASGEISRHADDSKIASAKLSIEAELKLPEMISKMIEFIKATCTAKETSASGDYSKLAASGYYSQLAASGDYSKLAASGDYSKLAASGDYSQLAASGYYSQLAASGDYSKLAASGNLSIAMSAGINSTASVGKLGCIVLTRWVESERRYRVSVGYVGEGGIKADTAYKLDDNGNFVEAS